MDTETDRWEKWTHFNQQASRSDRTPLIHMVLFERSTPQVGESGVQLHSQLGLSCNVSSNGLCMLVKKMHAPSVGEILRIRIQMSAVGVRTPTLADVRWVQTLPFEGCGLSFIGLKFSL
jgi:hypothetical protein